MSRPTRSRARVATRVSVLGRQLMDVHRRGAPITCAWCLTARASSTLTLARTLHVRACLVPVPDIVSGRGLFVLMPMHECLGLDDLWCMRWRAIHGLTSI